MNSRHDLVGFCLLIALFIVGCGPGGLEITDYQQGYNQGVREVREMRKEGGWAANLGGQMAVALEMFPTRDNKSADWNAGYRQGIKDEMAK